MLFPCFLRFYPSLVFIFPRYTVLGQHPYIRVLYLVYHPVVDGLLPLLIEHHILHHLEVLRDGGTVSFHPTLELDDASDRLILVVDTCERC